MQWGKNEWMKKNGIFPLKSHKPYTAHNSTFVYKVFRNSQSIQFSTWYMGKWRIYRHTHLNHGILIAICIGLFSLSFYYQSVRALPPSSRRTFTTLYNYLMAHIALKYSTTFEILGRITFNEIGCATDDEKSIHKLLCNNKGRKSHEHND